MFELIKLTETCYLCDEMGLAIVNPVDSSQWSVIDQGNKGEPSKVVFGPASFERCRVFIEFAFLGEAK